MLPRGMFDWANSAGNNELFRTFDDRMHFVQHTVMLMIALPLTVARSSSMEIRALGAGVA